MAGPYRTSVDLKLPYSPVLVVSQSETATATIASSTCESGDSARLGGTKNARRVRSNRRESISNTRSLSQRKWRGVPETVISLRLHIIGC